MKGKPKKGPRQKDLTDRYMDGSLDEDRIDSKQRFSSRSKNRQQDKMMKTSVMRAEDEIDVPDVSILPMGRVILVHSMFCQVEHETGVRLCVVRKTLTKMTGGDIVVGDEVRFRDLGTTDEQGRAEAIIEQILPRRTILTRSDSFKQIESHPIVANAEQMLIVASVREPNVKWGLIDRMLIAAQAGGLTPIVCLNKVDLADEPEIFDHYGTMGIQIIRTSVLQNKGIESLAQLLKNHTTVLAGHSGVGKSSLITAVQPGMDIRVGDISGYTGKGRHTTTSARLYHLHEGGEVIDTPGVKLFGLWNVTRDNLHEYFPDVDAGNAPEWRQESFGRILESLPE